MSALSIGTNEMFLFKWIFDWLIYYYYSFNWFLFKLGCLGGCVMMLFKSRTFLNK